MRISAETLEWLCAPDNPAVAVLTRRTLLHEADSPDVAELWSRRNEYAPVERILEAQEPDGSWAPPQRDYQKYRGSLWQIHFLGELMADGDDPRVARGADYAFSRQLADGSWSCTNMRPTGSIPCLTANVGRALARLGHARDERVVAALAQIAGVCAGSGCIACPAGGSSHTLNGYCHMVAPKILLFLGEVPREMWPGGAEELRAECVRVLREREVFRCLPAGYREFQEAAARTKAADRGALRDAWLARHGPLEYGDKPGWLRFGYPLSYNSDALEALRALAAVGETRREEYMPALQVVAGAADPEMRWTLRNSHNGKMLADVETKGRPSRWLTLHALRVLGHYGT
jgi:hypothetical protein